MKKLLSIFLCVVLLATGTIFVSASNYCGNGYDPGIIISDSTRNGTYYVGDKIKLSVKFDFIWAEETVYINVYNSAGSRVYSIFEDFSVWTYPGDNQGVYDYACVWDTRNLPAGKYTIETYLYVNYGGDSGRSPCDDRYVIEIKNKPASNGWKLENGKWAYYVNNVKLKNQWMKDSKGWCYLGADGYMLTNAWVKDSKGWCYVGANGYCVTNQWMKDSKGWCYLGADGRMVTNKWVKDSKGWCYVGANGYCITNQWMKDSKGWCYIGSEGRMVYNQWVKDSKGWCYVGSSGYMVYNQWVKYNNKWYYLDGNGYMVTGTKVINGKTYKFDSNGVLIG